MSGKSLNSAGRIDRRAARSRRLLHEALMRLIVRSDYDSITVQDLLDEADVGRSTFYAHYAGKDELLRKGFEHLRAELKMANEQLDGGANRPLAFSSAMFAHAERYRDVYRALVRSRGNSIVLAEIRHVLLSSIEPELETLGDPAVPHDLVARFIVDVLQSVLTWWLEKRPALSAPEIDRTFRQLVFQGLTTAGSSHRPASPNGHDN